MNSDLNLITAIFNKMKEHGFDVIKPLKWGFFFLDKGKDSLLDIINALDGASYSIESLELQEDGRWRLALSSVEILSPEKLHLRNLDFNNLASQYGAELYNGWDVQQVVTS